MCSPKAPSRRLPDSPEKLFNRSKLSFNMACNRATPPRGDCMLAALQQANALSVFSTSFPFAAMVTKRRWSAFCFVRFIHHAVILASTIEWVCNMRGAKDSLWNMESLELRGMGGLGGLKHGSRVDSFSVTRNNHTHLRSSFLSDSALPEHVDSPSIYTASSISAPFIRKLQRRSDAEQPRDTVQHVAWQIKAQFRAKHFFMGIGYLWLFSCYFTKMFLSARRVVASCYAASGLCIGWLGCSLLLEPSCSLHEPAILFMRALGFSSIGMVLIIEECSPLKIALLDAALQFSITLAHAAAAVGAGAAPPPLLGLSPAELFPHALVCATSVYWWVHQRKLQEDSLALVCSDKLRYDFWFEVLRAKSGDALDRLAALVAAHHRAASPHPGAPAPTGCRQLAADGRPLTSLTRLYAQAAVADGLLRQKMPAWAGPFNGCVPVDQTPPAAGDGDGAAGAGAGAGAVAFEPLRAAWDERGGARRERIRWVRLKSAGRAVEKLYRRYGGDVSRLLDVCRQSLVFDTVEQLSGCLEGILADPDVAVDRIKNRLDYSYDSLQSCGYRDVHVNLRLVSPAAVELGVNRHVCELQLTLKAVAIMKTESGHKRYIAFRNSRAV